MGRPAENRTQQGRHASLPGVRHAPPAALSPDRARLCARSRTTKSRMREIVRKTPQIFLGKFRIAVTPFARFCSQARKRSYVRFAVRRGKNGPYPARTDDLLLVREAL